MGDSQECLDGQEDAKAGEEYMNPYPEGSEEFRDYRRGYFGELAKTGAGSNPHNGDRRCRKN